MPTRKALIVGIDDYGSPQNNLNSCVADARAWEAKLRDDYGFQEIDVLLDGNATVRNVEDALDALFDGVQPDDRVVFFYSGHGFQVQRGEVRDEVLVLRDGFFPDDTLSQRSQRLPPGTLTVVLDSCFSGGMEKLIPSGDGFEVARAKRWTPSEEKLLEQQMEVKAQKRVKLRPFGVAKPEAPAKLAKDFGAPPSDEEGQLALNGLLISACLENETASARTERTRGLSAFSFAVMECLKQPRELLAEGPSVQALVARAAQLLHSLGFRQTPIYKEPPRPRGLAAQSFLLLNRSAQGIEGIMTAILNALREGTPMTTMGPQGLFGQGYQPMGMPGMGQPFGMGGIAGGMGGMGMGMGMGGGEQEKFFGSIVRTLSQVAPHVLPIVLQALKKEYQPGMEGFGQQQWGQPQYGGGQEKFLGAIFNVVAQAAPHVLPFVLQALKKEYQPGMEGMGQQWGQQQPGMGMGGGQEKFLGAIFSAVAQAAPHVLPFVLQALKKEYQPGMEGMGQQWGQQQPGMGMGMGGGQEKFLGAIFSVVAQAAPHVLPIVLQALRKEYQPGMEGFGQQQWGQPQYGMGGEEKGLGDIFRILAQQAPHILPQVLQALGRGGQFGVTGNGASA